MLPSFPRRILIVRRDNIGDLICTTPLLHTLRQAMPEAYLAVLVNSYNSAVLLGNPDVDEVLSYDKLKHRRGIIGKVSAVFARIALLAKMRMRRFDLAILAKSSFDRHGLRMARWAGVHDIVGVAPNGGARAQGLTHPITAERNEISHEVEIVARLGRALGIDERPGKMRLFPDTALKTAFRQRLIPHTGIKYWIALHISARESTRQWPAEKFIALTEGIRQHNAAAQIGFVLLWSPGAADNPMHPGDDDKAAEIMRRSENATVVAFSTDRLEELIAGTSVCDAFIGSDGGAMHVAVGLGLPIVALFENSEDKRLHWYPWQVAHRLVYPTTFAVEDIEVEAVAKAVEALLPVF